MDFDKEIIGAVLETKDNDNVAYLNALEADKLSELVSRSFDESFVLSTCQRLVVFVYALDKNELQDFFKTIGIAIEEDQLLQTTDDCARYIFEVASGCKSLIIGEHEILGQLRTSYQDSLENDRLGAHLDILVRSAISCGKRVRTETKFGSYQTSYASVGYDIIKRKFDSENDLSVLLVGTGSIAVSLMKILKKSGFTNINIFSHSWERALAFADEFEINPVAEANFIEVYNNSQIVIGGTHKQIDFKKFLSEGVTCPRYEMSVSEKQKLILDFGAPANFPVLSMLSNDNYYSLQRITSFLEESLDQRRLEVPKVEAIIDEEIEVFLKNLNQRKAAPLIGSYWNILLDIQQKELGWLLPKMGNITPKQEELILRYTNKLLRSISKKPIKQIKQWSEQPDKKIDRLNAINELIN